MFLKYDTDEFVREKEDTFQSTYANTMGAKPAFLSQEGHGHLYEWYIVPPLPKTYGAKYLTLKLIQ